jgi:hypothetical protein
MYGVRDLELVTVAANLPEGKAGVLRVLEKVHATIRNLLFASDDTAALQAAFDKRVIYQIVTDRFVNGDIHNTWAAFDSLVAAAPITPTPCRRPVPDP